VLLLLPVVCQQQDDDRGQRRMRSREARDGSCRAGCLCCCRCTRCHHDDAGEADGLLRCAATTGLLRPLQGLEAPLSTPMLCAAEC
jgi:hypothetical protein